jgi:hypothetical protein
VDAAADVNGAPGIGRAIFANMDDQQGASGGEPFAALGAAMGRVIVFAQHMHGETVERTWQQVTELDKADPEVLATEAGQRATAYVQERAEELALLLLSLGEALAAAGGGELALTVMEDPGAVETEGLRAGPE